MEMMVPFTVTLPLEPAEDGARASTGLLPTPSAIVLAGLRILVIDDDPGFSEVVQLLLSRIGVGIGEAGGTPGANSIISDYFPQSKRPMALTVIFALAVILAAMPALAVADRGALTLEVSPAFTWWPEFWQRCCIAKRQDAASA